MKRLILALGLLAAVFTFTAPAQAASQNECAIWICLPGGFPSGCGAAYSAMIHRVEHFKPPLPDFASCAVNPPQGSGSHMTSSFGVSAYVPAHRVCTRWYGRDDNMCASWEMVPEQHIKGTSCRRDRDGYTQPAGCTRTDRWAEVFTDGAQTGPTYFWH